VSSDLSIRWNEPADPARADAVIREVDRLFSAGLLNEALDLLSATWPGLPKTTLHDSHVDGLLIRAIAQVRTGQTTACLATLQALSQCNVSVHLASPTFDPLWTLEGYPEFAERNDALLQRERGEAHVRWEAIEPPGLSSSRPAALMLVFHGDPGNLTRMKTMWPAAPGIEHGAVVAYVQSSQLRSTGRYVWSLDGQKAWSDIRTAYEQLRDRYAAGGSPVILAGFSAGATTALDLVFGQGLPAAGFIGLCPGETPVHFAREQIVAARDRGVRGVFLDSADDWPDEDQRALMDALQAVAFPVNIVLHTGDSHAAPPDFADRLRRAVRHVLA